MTIDVNLARTTQDFLEDIDEIMEDTMIQMFFLQPQNAQALHKAKEDAKEHDAIFYAAPLALKESVDENCIGYRIQKGDKLPEATLNKPLFVDENELDDELIATLGKREEKGFILNATKAYEPLKNFLVAIGPLNAKQFDTEVLAAISMDKIALQSGFPDNDIYDIEKAVKIISDAMFRPEQSIIARATKQTLIMSGFRK